MGQSEVTIPEKIFFKIGEVCEILDVQAHVLRYWETEFPMLSPQKNRSGQRTYRRRDVEMALRIKDLLYEDLYTIAGAKKRLQTEIKEGKKLKVAKKEEPAAPPPPDILEEDLELISLEIDEPEETDGSPKLFDTEAPKLTEEKTEALKSLASQLLELREMLKSKAS